VITVPLAFAYLITAVYDGLWPSDQRHGAVLRNSAKGDVDCRNRKRPHLTKDPPTELDRLMTLLEVSRSLTSELGLQEIIHEVLAGAIQVIPGADAGVLFLYDSDRGGLVASDAVGFGPAIYEILVAPGEGLSGKAFQSTQAIMYPDRAAVAACMSNTSAMNLRRMETATSGLTYAHSALTCPLIYKGEALGSIVIENLFTPKVFNDFDPMLLEGLAQAASVALVNARLYESEREARLKVEALNDEARRRHDLIQKQLAIRESFAEVVREGPALPVLAARLASICEASTMIVDRLYRVRASAPSLASDDVSEILGADWTAVEPILLRAETTRSRQTAQALTGPILVTPLCAGPNVLGFILLRPPGRFIGDTDTSASDSAAAIATIEFLREHSAKEADLRRNEDLLASVLSGREWSGRQGRSLRLPLVIAVGDLREPHTGKRPLMHSVRQGLLTVIMDLIGRDDATALVGLRSGQIVLLSSAVGTIERGLESVVDRLHQLPDKWDGVFAISEPAAALADVRDRYREACVALIVHHELQRKATVFRVNSLGAYRLIFRAASEADTVDLCQRVLGRVLRSDARSTGRILDSFRTYLANGNSVTATARKLGVHPHTVRYRLHRLEQLTSLSLANVEDRLTLELATRVLDMVGANKDQDSVDEDDGAS
jgi:GAF domain-containing protein